jgi:hypothetical protein
MKPVLILLLTLVISLVGAEVLAFDHQHSGWDQLLKKHVRWINEGTASQVDYAGFNKDTEHLQRYLDTLSAVSQVEFGRWSKAQQLAFLINAYNAFTVQLVLSKYPDLKSIKDLGSLFRSPWQKEFFQLLGKPRNLDEIEHGMIRHKGVYDEPRIHFAVNCASIGCPALRDEAFVADKLDNQLEDSFRRFLADRSRNRFNPQTGSVEVSKIFDWYKEDFSSGYRNFNSLHEVFARYAKLLADRAEDQQRLKEGRVSIQFLDYDWGLNDVPG